MESLACSDLPEGLKPSIRAEIHRIRGFIAVARGNAQTAVAELTQVKQQKDPLNPLWLDRLAFLTTTTWAHLEVEDLEGAASLLTELNASADGLPGGSLEAKVVIGLLQARKQELEGRFESAIQGYRAALADPPGGVKYDVVAAQAHRRWVDLLRDQGREVDARLAEQRRKKYLAPQFSLATPP